MSPTLWRVLAVACLLTALWCADGSGWAAPKTNVSRRGDVWLIENDRLRVAVDPVQGRIAVRDRGSGYLWRQPGDGALPATFRDVKEIPTGLSFQANFGATEGRPNTIAVSLRVPANSSDLIIGADMADRNAQIASFTFLEPFLLDTERPVLAVADYSNGHLYPLDLKPFPAAWLDGGRLDMPWVGVCDLERGMGYALILETSDDASVRCAHYPAGERQLAAPQVGWHPSKGRFGYPRQVVYRFVSTGGYVALAKAYRAYAREQGLIVPFAEKLRHNPTIRRLFGAPDVWGDASLKFAREAKAAGVEKMLIHGRSTPEEMWAINELGYLTSEYDNYTDILPVEEGGEPDSSHDRLPEAAVLNADGTRMGAWVTWDGKTRYMKRCPALWLPTTQLVVPKVLAEFPFLGRFIDVTTAEGLYECYDERHPLTRAQKRQCGMDLLGDVRARGLVVGGEHGIWWGASLQDYIEGMMSSYQFSWPAGHLIRPQSKDQEFTGPWGKLGPWSDYEKWGIGHQWRVPLWELVFHDCVVSTWYWGDSSDFLLQAAPEVTPKKDAFNILYGTIPLLWADGAGAWRTARDVFLRTYRNTCKLHEVIAGLEMLSHEFLTPDHAMQRTVFADGTEVVVNFGESPYELPVPRLRLMRRWGGGSVRRVVLPQNGFLVTGPHIEQSLVLVEGRPVTTIRQDGYLFTDAGGRELTLRLVEKDHLRVHLGGVGGQIAPVSFRPADVAPGWELTSTRAFALDAAGERTHQVECRVGRRGQMTLEPIAGPVTLDVVCRSQAALPDLRFGAEGVAVSPGQPRQGEQATVSAVVHNGGGRAAKGVEIAVYADAINPERKLTAQTIALDVGKSRLVALTLDTSSLDGTRRLLVVADSDNRVAELCERNNAAAGLIEVKPDFARWTWQRALRVDAGELEWQDEPVVVPMEAAGVDPASVRVVECDEQGLLQAEVPAQFDVGPEERGELCFLLRGRTPARATRRFRALWNPAGSSPALLAPASSGWDGAAVAFEGETYRVEFSRGTLVNLAARRNGSFGPPFISMLILSSQETGWGDEPGTVERFEVLHSGPLRTIVFVRKALQAGVVYEKTYTFYPRRFEVAISVNRPAGGLYSRAYYLQPGTYVDSGGCRATVDGQGDAEGVSAQTRSPRWYAVYADGWAHSCVALSPFDHLAYWDAGYWGGIGLVTGETKGLRMSYVIHPGAPDAAFAEEDDRRLTSPVAVEWE